MSICINTHCSRPQNPENILFCQGCGSELLLEGQYRVIRQLGEGGFGKTFEVSHSNTLKVLKVLTLDDAKAVSLEFELYLPIFETSVRTLRTQRTHS